MKEIQVLHTDLLEILPRYYHDKKLLLTGYYSMIPKLREQEIQNFPTVKQYILHKFGKT